MPPESRTKLRKPRVFLPGHQLPRAERSHLVSWLTMELPNLVELVSRPEESDLFVAISPYRDFAELAAVVNHLQRDGRVLVLYLSPHAPTANLEAKSPKVITCPLVNLIHRHPHLGECDHYLSSQDALQIIFRRAHAIVQAQPMLFDPLLIPATS